jgi:hypothetical protein
MRVDLTVDLFNTPLSSDEHGHQTHLPTRQQRLGWAGVRGIFEAVDSRDKLQFVPKGEGVHGAFALVTPPNLSDEYWVAVKAFLSRFK